MNSATAARFAVGCGAVVVVCGIVVLVVATSTLDYMLGGVYIVYGLLSIAQGVAE